MKNLFDPNDFDVLTNKDCRWEPTFQEKEMMARAANAKIKTIMVPGPFYTERFENNHANGFPKAV